MCGVWLYLPPPRRLYASWWQQPCLTDHFRSLSLGILPLCSAGFMDAFFRLFPISVYYKVLNIFPCAIQQVLTVHLFHIQQCVCYSQTLNLSLPLSSLATITFLCLSLLLFCKQVHLYLFFNIPHKNNIWCSPFSVWLTSLSEIISRPIDATANGTVSFFLRLRNIPLYRATHLLYPSKSGHSLLPCLNYCK